MKVDDAYVCGVGHQELSRPLLLYAGRCRFCRWVAKTLASLDEEGALAFLPLRDERATPYLAHLSEKKRFSTWWLVERDGTLHHGGSGGIRVLEHIARTQRLARRLRALHLDRPLNVLDLIVKYMRVILNLLVPKVEPPERFP